MGGWRHDSRKSVIKWYNRVAGPLIVLAFLLGLVELLR